MYTWLKMTDVHYISKVCYLIKQTSGCRWCLFTNKRFKVSKIFIKEPGTVACAVILATGTVDIGCLQW